MPKPHRGHYSQSTLCRRCDFCKRLSTVASQSVTSQSETPLTVEDLTDDQIYALYSVWKVSEKMSTTQSSHATILASASTMGVGSFTAFSTLLASIAKPTPENGVTMGGIGSLAAQLLGSAAMWVLAGQLVDWHRDGSDKLDHLKDKKEEAEKKKKNLFPVAEGSGGEASAPSLPSTSARQLKRREDKHKKQ